MKIDYVHSKELHNESAPQEVLPALFALTKPESIIDIGCGIGSWLKVAKELGISKVCGVDGIKADKKLFMLDEADFIQADLSLPISTGQKYDMAFCLEVAEHLPPGAADTIVDTLVNHSDIILFSAAIPGQGGQAHINEQPPEYWQGKFEKRGYQVFDLLRDKFWDNPNVDWWYKQNMMIYANAKGAVVLGHQPVKTIPYKIHPQLFDLRINELSAFKSKIWYPKIGFSLRLVVKSIVHVFRK